MEQEDKSFLEAFEEKKLPGTLNVLTILTFIGCGFMAIGAIWGFFSAKDTYEKMDTLINSGDIDKMPSFLRGMYNQDMLEVTRKNYENRLPILIIYLVSTALCLFGAIKMRQQKKDGYTAWLIGEVLPFVGSVLFVGAAAFRGFSPIFGIIVTGVFVVLYTTQRKNLS